MNKIICDVCGTDYPETAAQCPICGCASAGAQTVAGNEMADVEEKAGYTPVKGGRYSKSNVRKRLKANQIPYDPMPTPVSDPEPEYEDDNDREEAEEEEDTGSNRGLVIVIVILLLAIVAVASYIAISIFGLGIDKLPVSTNQPTASQTVSTTEPTSSVTEVACTELSLSDVDVYLKTVGSVWQLTATPVPADTTDEVIFTSSDENVVTVDEFGLITAVGNGEASIIVTCGDITVDCPVLCGEKDAEVTEPTTEATEPTTEPTEPTEEPEDFVLKLKSKDFTLKKAGATYKLYDGEVDAADITWSTDDEEVVTIKDGVVTAVGNGRTRVYGEYGDQKVSCWVSIKLPEEATEPTEPEGTEPEETEPEDAAVYAIRVGGKKPSYGTEQAAEATITIGEELNVKIVKIMGDAEKRVDVEWTASKSGIVTVEGNTITGVKAGTVTLTAVIDGQKLTYKLIVKA